MSQASAVASPKVPAEAGGKGFKAELDSLRERMRALGLSHDEIAAEVSRRYQVRLRQAYRLAWDWTLDQAAARFNERAASEGTDPQGRASMTGPHLCEVEKWPDSSRKPSAYVLCLLACVYETDVLCLLDLADHESLPQQDRLVLMRRLRAETTFGGRVLALAEARGLPLREVARRVPCDASDLAEVAHGRERPSLRLAARLDDLLEAAGELVALAVAAPQDVSELEQDPRQQAGGRRALTGGGLSLTLPYVPARLVIEVSGPAENPGLLASAADGSGMPAGRLALVRDSSPGTAHREAAGR
jgi:transcriptional regulator with XRE-family HTH domain